MRHIDLQTASIPRSMAVFHAIGEGAGQNDEITLVTVKPAGAFVSVGYHQLASREIRADYCRARKIPVCRRMVGGGAVLLDPGQIFWHLILPGARAAIHDLYAALLPAPVSAYRRMGILAEARSLNDIVVGQKKIGGTGAATLGQSLIFVGSLMFDFDRDLMTNVLNVPSEKFRDKMVQSLKDYMTTIHDELADRAPSQQEAVGLLVEEFSQLLDSPVHKDTLTDKEEQLSEHFEHTLFDPSFVFQDEGWFEERVKIRDGVYLYEGLAKAPGGLVRAIWQDDHGIVKDAWIGGDFTLEPSRALDVLKERWKGQPTDLGVLRLRTEEVFAELGIAGLTVDDVMAAFARPERMVGP